MVTAIAVLVAVVVAAAITWPCAIGYRKKVVETKLGNAEDRAREIVDEALKAAETKKREAMLEAKGIITWLPLAPVRRQWGRILKEIHTPVIPRCVFVYISNEERNTLQKSYRLLQPEVILQELPDLCNQNK